MVNIKNGFVIERLHEGYVVTLIDMPWGEHKTVMTNPSEVAAYVTRWLTGGVSLEPQHLKQKGQPNG